MLRSLSFAAVAAAMVASAAQASTLSGQFGGTIATPDSYSSSSFVSSGGGSDTFSWGSPNGASQQVVPGDASSLTVNDTAFSHSGTGDFLLGSITWDNHSNWHAGGTWNSVLTLNLTVGTQAASVPVSFSMYNSTDVSIDTDHNEAMGNNPDVASGLTLETSGFNLPVKLGNGFRLTDIYFGLADAGTAGLGWNATDGFTYNGQPAGSQYIETTGLWEVREGAVSTLGVYGTVSPVPLPAGLWLMFTMLGGYFMLGKRQRRTA